MLRFHCQLQRCTVSTSLDSCSPSPLFTCPRSSRRTHGEVGIELRNLPATHHTNITTCLPLPTLHLFPSLFHTPISQYLDPTSNRFSRAFAASSISNMSDTENPKAKGGKTAGWTDREIVSTRVDVYLHPALTHNSSSACSTWWSTPTSSSNTA